MCKTFIELTENPYLGEIDRSTIRKYETLLRQTPENNYLATRKYKTSSLLEIIKLTKTSNEILASEKKVRLYINKISEFFSWAVSERFMVANPASKIIGRSKTLERTQDQRSLLEKEDLHLIFSADWFKYGSGSKNKYGRYHQFQPFYYWLPLLALYTGARINELAQLDLTDIIEYEKGKYLLSINENNEELTSDRETDKKLKNENSIRNIPIHTKLIGLGLVDYKIRLERERYTRLFPELKRDPIKGYGKAAGSWFNERFLGKRLGIKRDGKKSYHSFRHTFLTMLEELQTPARIRSELAGHQRGETITDTRYTKDSQTINASKYVEKLSFDLPPIANFDCEAGIDALTDALRRKGKNV